MRGGTLEGFGSPQSMGVGITESRTLLIWIGANASTEAHVHTSSVSGDQGEQG